MKIEEREIIVKNIYSELVREMRKIEINDHWSDEFKKGYEAAVWDLKIALKDSYGIEVPREDLK